MNKHITRNSVALNNTIEMHFISLVLLFLVAMYSAQGLLLFPQLVITSRELWET